MHPPVYPMSKLDQLAELLSLLSLRLVDTTARHPDIKGKKYAVYDGNRLLCEYSTPSQIINWLRRKAVKPNEPRYKKVE